MIVKAIQIHGDGLSWSDCEDVEPEPHEVRIAVRASAVNRADLLQRRGDYPPPPGASEILGLECAGVVDVVGRDVTSFDCGDEVCALLAGGGYAEKVVVPAPQVLPVPSGISLVEAAALPEVFATAYLNLFMEAGLTPGERVLLHAAASGVGTAAVQLCRAFGSPSFITAGSDEKIARCRKLGAEAGCNRHREQFGERVAEWTGGAGMDVILDPVGGRYLEENLKSLSVEGRLVLIGLMGGAEANIHLGLILAKRLKLVGSTLRARPVAQKGEVMAALRERVWPRISEGEIKPIVDTVFPMDRVADAHDLLASNATFGKVLLEVP
jgi:putative PIG3 family NAD(P)H quinone oxidoreductase